MPSEIKGEEGKMSGEGREVSCPPDGVTLITRHTHTHTHITLCTNLNNTRGGGIISEVRGR